METVKKWIQTIKEFFGEVKGEVLKVSYPTKSEVIGSTTVVILLTLVVSIFLAVMDSILVRLLKWVF
ncbi:MAG: preprotein translocase subunit SecE [Nitrospirae bacterium]|nr:preprotein translocase subunit SecE [Candidatus Troglogloeales bacterium]MBI3598734.1 preprotein translocase subunit SecE [Candidatus Troglogloeales bacterium]